MKRLILILILPLFLFGGLLDSLTHAYKFDGNASDSSGTAHGTIYGATKVIGKHDSCYYYDGENDYISVNGMAGEWILSTFSDSSFAISYWFNTDSNWADNSSAVWATSYPASSSYFRLGHSNDSVLVSIFQNSYVQGFFTKTEPYTKNTWHHFLYNHSNGKGVVYVDGINTSDSLYYSSITAWQNATSAEFGRLNWNSNNPEKYYLGKIDEAYFWNRTLDNAEILKLSYGEVDSGSFYPFADTDTFLIDWNGIDLDLIDTWNGIDLDLIQSINGINLK